MRAASALASGFALAGITVAANAQCTGVHSATSGVAAPVVVELYTSEGCNSCPPADRWLSQAVARAGKAGDGAAPFIPLAFHVDYWDYIGWKDVFAQPAFAQRQGALARAGGASGVYTPQVFVNGRDDRNWTRDAVALRGTGGAAARAGLKFNVSSAWRDDAVTISGRLTEPSARVRLRYAVTENGLVTAVKAGENKGETLRHDAVVRAHGPLTADANGAFTLEVRLPRTMQRRASLLHVIAEDGVGKPLAAATIACAG
jgi:hypothetical protein